MTKKSLGYVELEWECPNCGGRNPGREKVCTFCGTAQPADVSFQQAAEEKIIEDAVVIEKAKVGPDIHCAYCGTRNPADAETCSRCGADLSEGSAREAGQVIGAHKKDRAKDITCSYCGSLNPGTARQCWNCGATLELEKPKPVTPKPMPAASGRTINPLIFVVIGIFFIAACIGLFIFLNQTDDVQGRVSDLAWERSIVILGLVPVRSEGWQDELPNNADVGFCQQAYRYTSAEWQPNSTEVCGTPYTVDTGSGLGEVLQDCEYQVYDVLCEYTVLMLQPINTLVAEGHDQNPSWPAARLENGQEEGERDENYRITFSADGEQFVYRTDDVEEYRNFTLGSNWTLKINKMGGVTEVQPAR